MATTMKMSGYEIEREVVAVDEYGEEVLCAGWNPQLELVRDDPKGVAGVHAVFAHELANVDIDSFLQKMYKFQR
jgi:hypothetical protein